MLSPFRLSSVCLSVCRPSVTFVHPTQPVEIFVWYLGHPLTFTKHLGRSSQGNPSVGDLNARGVAKYSDFDILNAITSKRCKIGGKLVLITNRKSYMGFRLVPK